MPVIRILGQIASSTYALLHVIIFVICADELKSSHVLNLPIHHYKRQATIFAPYAHIGLRRSYHSVGDSLCLRPNAESAQQDLKFEWTVSIKNNSLQIEIFSGSCMEVRGPVG